ncbi:MAG TPA: peptide ABC transporter substrate-binding protein [Ktedonobacteraceae bacterium]|nr:peptide ABC transporter substrate-binding protein [Ktedonobacteraceae bacterium]
MRSRKKLATMLLPSFLALIAMLFAACGGGTSAPSTSGPTKAPASQQVFTFPEEGVADIATFDPALAGDLNSAQAIYMVFTGLVSLNDQLQIKPQLASSWSTSTDGLTWTFHLRPNLKFSDGTPLTSADVIYSINRSVDPATASPVGPYYLALLKDLNLLTSGKIKTLIGDSLLAPDPSTVVIKISKPASYFLDALTYPTSYVVEQSLITTYGKNWTDHLTAGGGDGPFKVSSYIHSKEIDFVPNTNYYGSKPQLQKVIFPFYKQSDTAYRAYQVNQVDIAGVPTADLAAAKALPNGQFHQTPQLSVFYYAMNYLVKPFDNIDIRQAFELAINKDLIANNVYKGAVIATNHIVPKGMPGYTPNLTGPDGVTGTSGDVAKAKALLQQGLTQEGWTSVTQMPSITMVYPSGSVDTDNEMAAVTQMWQNNLGISVKLAPTDFNKMLNEINAAINNPKGLQMWQIGWIADYPDPQDWTTLQFCNGCAQNAMNYGQNHTSDAAAQQQVQQQLVAADSMPAGPARIAVYNTAEQQLVNDVAWLPTYQSIATTVLKPYVQGVIFNADGLTPPDDWGNIYISTH